MRGNGGLRIHGHHILASSPSLPSCTNQPETDNAMHNSTEQAVADTKWLVASSDIYNRYVCMHVNLLHQRTAAQCAMPCSSHRWWCNPSHATWQSSILTLLNLSSLGNVHWPRLPSRTHQKAWNSVIIPLLVPVSICIRIQNQPTGEKWRLEGRLHSKTPGMPVIKRDINAYRRLVT